MSNLPVSFWRSVIIIVLVALTTFATRVIPFLLFPDGKEIPKTVQYLENIIGTVIDVKSIPDIHSAFAQDISRHFGKTVIRWLK